MSGTKVTLEVILCVCLSYHYKNPDVPDVFEDPAVLEFAILVLFDLADL